jgi:hypothetical protein
MPEIDVVDSSWVGVAPAVVAPVVADPDNWRRWWPDLELRVHELRGPKGVRWTVLSGRGGTVTGSMEIWLEGVDGGTVVHYFLRLDGTGARLTRRQRERIVTAYRTRAKRAFWTLADRLDPGRIARLAGPPTGIP